MDVVVEGTPVGSETEVPVDVSTRCWRLSGFETDVRELTDFLAGDHELGLAFGLFLGGAVCSKAIDRVWHELGRMACTCQLPKDGIR